MDLAELLRRLQLDLTGLANMLRAVGGFPFLRGREVRGVIDAGETVLRLPHGLGRAFRGGIVLHQSQLLSPVVFFSPELAKAAGIDITQQFAVGLAVANPGATIFSVWVF